MYQKIRSDRSYHNNKTKFNFSYALLLILKLKKMHYRQKNRILSSTIDLHQTSVKEITSCHISSQVQKVSVNFFHFYFVFVEL